MHNDDLIAFLQPVPNRFHSHEWRDVTGSIGDIRVEPHRFVLRASLPPGLYRCRIETKPGAFDMNTAMLPLVRVPDGKRVSIGPWDLDHFQNVMSIPTVRTFVNGKLRGGLWFAMPGPDQIAKGQLWADFGFEAEDGETELVLEIVERDRSRIDWARIAFMEFRKDNRSLCPLLPQGSRRPRVYVNADELGGLRKRLLADPAFLATWEGLRQGTAAPREGVLIPGVRDQDMRHALGRENGRDLRYFVYLITGDKTIGIPAKDEIVELCRLPTWSYRPDPLLMGGDNDRGIGFCLYYAGLAWEYLAPLFSEEERRVVLAKVGEYLQTMYDFTVLQRAYMGHPTIDAHSLGGWNGMGVACMAFYDDLPVARKALPFFHGLFCDGLQLFPPGGKASWATYYPFHLIRYLAAAHTFGGQRPELDRSPFLDNLGKALIASFESPNAQELQRGLRTREHRYLTAFLSRFHPTDGIESIYQTFVEREKSAAGDVDPGLFDFLFAPARKSPVVPFARSPLFARDIGNVWGVTQGEQPISFSLNAGLKAGARASFSLLPHNREYGISMASLEVSVDNTPVLMSPGQESYGLDNAILNTMCWEEGGSVVQGQWLCGDIGPEKNSFIRRCLITDRFVYAHAVVTEVLDPKLRIRQADRIMIVDTWNGVLVLQDSFAGDRPLRFATHLHCAGSIRSLSPLQHRLTGGQANLIAGISGGIKDLSDEEKGEIFATILGATPDQRVVTGEAAWIPCYIYGLNSTADQDPANASYPHFQRWRLETTQPVTHGSFLFALSTDPDAVHQTADCIQLPGGASLHLADFQPVTGLGCECVAESVLIDPSAHKLVLIGARRLAVNGREMAFSVPTDVECSVADGAVQGTVYSTSSQGVALAKGFHVHVWQQDTQHPRSTCDWSARFELR